MGQLDIGLQDLPRHQAGVGRYRHLAAQAAAHRQAGHVPAHHAAAQVAAPIAHRIHAHARGQGQPQLAIGDGAGRDVAKVYPVDEALARHHRVRGGAQGQVCRGTVIHPHHLAERHGVIFPVGGDANRHNEKVAIEQAGGDVGIDVDAAALAGGQGTEIPGRLAAFRAGAAAGRIGLGIVVVIEGQASGHLKLHAYAIHGLGRTISYGNSVQDALSRNRRPVIHGHRHHNRLDHGHHLLPGYRIDTIADAQADGMGTRSGKGMQLRAIAGAVADGVVGNGITIDIQGTGKAIAIGIADAPHQGGRRVGITWRGAGAEAVDHRRRVTGCGIDGEINGLRHRTAIAIADGKRGAVSTRRNIGVGL